MALPSSVIDLHPRCSQIWRSRERVDDGDTKGLEMPEVTGQNGQPVMLCCSGDDDVGKSRWLAEASRPIRDRAGNPRCCRIESKHPIAVEMQNRVQPCRRINALTGGALASRLGDSVLDFRHRDNRKEQRG